MRSARRASTAASTGGKPRFKNTFPPDTVRSESGSVYLRASDYGVPQLHPRVVLVALRENRAQHFSWPTPGSVAAQTVGESLFDLMASNGWPGAKSWRERASIIAPTLVGGSKKHGGPDFGPTRAKKARAAIGVDGLGIANEVPSRDFVGMPRLTVRMAAWIQGIPDSWSFSGKKTAVYRQIGNAFPATNN